MVYGDACEIYGEGMIMRYLIKWQRLMDMEEQDEQQEMSINMIKYQYGIKQDYRRNS